MPEQGLALHADYKTPNVCFTQSGPFRVITAKGIHYGNGDGFATIL